MIQAGRWIAGSIFFIMTTAAAANAAPTQLAARHPARTAAHTTVFTAADNGKTIHLRRGDTLIVRLRNPGDGGYSWFTVLEPNGPFQLVKSRAIPSHHAPGVVGDWGQLEYWFRLSPSARSSSTATEASYLRLMAMQPFEPAKEALKTADIWEVKVSW